MEELIEMKGIVKIKRIDSETIKVLGVKYYSKEYLKRSEMIAFDEGLRRGSPKYYLNRS